MGFWDLLMTVCAYDKVYAGFTVKFVSRKIDKILPAVRQLYQICLLLFYVTMEIEIHSSFVGKATYV